MAALQQYNQMISPIAFGAPTTMVTSQQPRQNPLTMAAGGAMTGAAMGNMIGMGGMGAAIGGGLGLLGGLL